MTWVCSVAIGQWQWGDCHFHNWLLIRLIMIGFRLTDTISPMSEVQCCWKETRRFIKGHRDLLSSLQPEKRTTTMGKKGSKLKQETIDSLTHDTYCKSFLFKSRTYLLFIRLASARKNISFTRRASWAGSDFLATRLAAGDRFRSWVTKVRPRPPFSRLYDRQPFQSVPVTGTTPLWATAAAARFLFLYLKKNERNNLIFFSQQFHYFRQLLRLEFRLLFELKSRKRKLFDNNVIDLSCLKQKANNKMEGISFIVWIPWMMQETSLGQLKNGVPFQQKKRRRRVSFLPERLRPHL